MRSLQQRLKVFLPVMLLTASAFTAKAQQQGNHPVSVGLNYTYIHTNILSGCRCFSLNGGGAVVQVAFSPQWSGILDITGTARSGITQANYNLTQLTYTAGLRYIPPVEVRSVRGFGEALVGSAYTWGSLAPSNALGATSNVFALQAGGGLLIKLRPRLQLMPAQVDYLRTNFQNGAANHQNDVRVSAGILVRLNR